MRTINAYFKFSLLAVAIISITSFSSCSKMDDDSGNSATTGPVYSVTGSGSGDQVVPAVSTSGTATFSGLFDSNTNLLTYTTTWTGLSTAPTGGGLYIGGRSMTGTPVGSFSFEGTVGTTGSLTGSIVLTDEQESQLLNGNLYYSYSTSANAGGEVRGQIAAFRR